MSPARLPRHLDHLTAGRRHFTAIYKVAMDATRPPHLPQPAQQGHRTQALSTLWTPHTAHLSPTQASNSPTQEKSRGTHCWVGSWALAPGSASPSPRATPEAGGGWASRELWGPMLQLTTYYPPGLRAPPLGTEGGRRHPHQCVVTVTRLPAPGPFSSHCVVPTQPHVRFSGPTAGPTNSGQWYSTLLPQDRTF